MDQAGNLLLPLFFIVTGLSLNVGAIRGDCARAARGRPRHRQSRASSAPPTPSRRACGLEPRESATIAALVNTRGLTELIALNVGLADGLINQQLFTVLVLMALLTTLMTGPLLTLIRPVRAPRPAAAGRLTNT